VSRSKLSLFPVRRGWRAVSPCELLQLCIAETGAERIAHLSASRQLRGLYQKKSRVLFCLDSLWVKSQNYMPPPRNHHPPIWQRRLESLIATNERGKGTSSPDERSEMRGPPGPSARFHRSFPAGAVTVDCRSLPDRRSSRARWLTAAAAERMRLHTASAGGRGCAV
jgi:hypothetical protein